MLIIKGAIPAIARQKVVRATLTRIDVDRTRDRYDIYIDDKNGLSFDIVNVYDNKYLNVRAFPDRKHVLSFQINLRDVESVIII